MAHDHFINRLSQQFGDRLPSSLLSTRAELEDTLRSLLRDALSRMDLLTRDELDLQQALLARTRSKVDALEKVVEGLEARITELEADSRRTQ